MATFSPFSSVFVLCLIIATVSSSISAQSDVVAAFAQALEQTKNITGDPFDPATLNVTKNVADEIITAAASAASAVNDTESGVGDFINGATSALNKTVDDAESAVNETVTGGDYALGDATSAVNNTVNGADDIIGGATSAVNSTVNGADDVIDGATSVVNGTKGAAEDVVDGTKQIAGDHSEAPSTTAFSARGTVLLLVFAVIGWVALPVLF